MSTIDCAHDQGFATHREEREVRCVACGALLDPYALLADLETLVAAVEWKQRQLDATQAAIRDRQQFAIRRKQRAQLHAAQLHCPLCQGTGWAPGGIGVVVCRCRRARVALERSGR